MGEISQQQTRQNAQNPSVRLLGSMMAARLSLSRPFSTSNKLNLKDVVIASASRTPMGGFRGPMAAIPAPKLGALTIEETLKRANIDKDSVDEVYMGNVLPGGMMQAPDRQAALFAGLSPSIPCTMINKVCASGMKSVMLGASNIAAGRSNIVVAGGFESPM